MDVSLKRQKTDIEFGGLLCGEAFRLFNGNKIYIKIQRTQTIDGGHNFVNAIALTDGNIACFATKELVCRLKPTAHIEFEDV